MEDFMTDTATVTRPKHIHEVRGITFQEYAALLATREMLRNGDLTFTSSCFVQPGKHTFNMRVAGTEAHCGSVGCIGGNMAFIMGRDPQRYVGGNGSITRWDAPADPDPKHASLPFQHLFYPPGDNGTQEWGWITPAIAAQAIDNWLKTGDPQWHKLKAAVDAAEARDNAAKARLALSEPLFPYPAIPARKVAKKPARKVAKKPVRKGVRKSPRY